MNQKNNKRNFRNDYNNILKKVNLNNSNEDGYLKIRVTSGLGKFPLSGAKVTVYATKEEELVPVQTETTDEMGYCPIIQLPVSYNPEAEEMDPIYYYTDYNFSVSFNNYYPTATYSVQMFPGITTEFDVNMNPVPAIDPYVDRINQTVMPKIGL